MSQIHINTQQIMTVTITALLLHWACLWRGWRSACSEPGHPWRHWSVPATVQEHRWNRAVPLCGRSRRKHLFPLGPNNPSLKFQCTQANSIVHLAVHINKSTVPECLFLNTRLSELKYSISNLYLSLYRLRLLFVAILLLVNGF